MYDVNQLFKDARNILDDLGIKYWWVADIRIDRTHVSFWGRATYRSAKNNYVITISSRLLNESVPYTSALNTVVHELLHCHRDRMCHTGEWKRCAKIVNAAHPELHIQRCTSAEELGVDDVVAHKRDSAKYIITCESCGCVSRYLRASRVVKLFQTGHGDRCKCGRCGASRFTFKEV